MVKRALAAALLLAGAGCGINPPTAYVSSLTDPQYQVTHEAVFIFVPDDAPIADRQFAAPLQAAMAKAGFAMVDHPSKSRWILTFNTGTKSSTINSTLFLPQTQTTTGRVGNIPYSSNTHTTAAVPVSRSYTVAKAWLYLYSTDDIRASRVRTAWEGSVGAETWAWDAYRPQILQLLLERFGTDYQAPTTIPFN